MHHRCAGQSVLVYDKVIGLERMTLVNEAKKKERESFFSMSAAGADREVNNGGSEGYK